MTTVVDWKSAAQAQQADLVAIRHRIHAHPELAFEEVETSRLVLSELKKCDLELRTGLAKGNGIVAVLRGTAKGADSAEARSVALRADMDALPIHEKTGLPYASTIDGKMHACGHDGHTTMLLGAARVLSKHRDRLKGNVVFCFQPAEETGGGGRYLVEEGALDDPACSAAFALHGASQIPLGKVGIRHGASHAATDGLQIRVCGVGGHGASPHLTVDPVLLSARVIEALQSIVSREVNPAESALVTIGAIHGGMAGNVIPEFVELTGTIRTHKEEIRQLMYASVKRTAQGVCEAGGGTAEVNIIRGYPTLANDLAAAGMVDQIACAAFGEENTVRIEHPTMGGEDFSYYLQKVPGCFIRIGVGTREDYPMVHNPKFDFTDAAIAVGVEMHCRIAERYLESGFTDSASSN